MNRRSRHLGVLSLALFALGVACSPFTRQASSPSAGPAAAVHAALDRRVSVEFADATLPEVLEALSRQAGVRVYADGPAASKAEKWTSDDWLVTGKLTDVALETVLRTMADSAGLLVDPRADGIAMATVPNGTNLPTVTHVIPPALLDVSIGSDERRLADVLESLIDPESWESVGGTGAIEVLPGALIIVQTPANQRRIASFIAGIECCRTGGEAASSHDPEFASSATVAIMRAWDAPCAMPFDAMSLPALLEHVSIEHALNIVLCDAPWYGPTPVDRYFVEASDERLGKVLQRALAAFEMEATVFDGVLVIDASHESKWSTLAWRIHPAPADMLDACRADSDSLVAVVTRHIGPDMWSEVGGPGEIALVPGGVAVAAPESVDQLVGRFLADLTRAFDPTRLNEPPEPTPSVRTLQAALDQPATIDLNYGDVRQNLIDLFDSLGLPPLRFDDDALQDAHITLPVHWPLRLENVPLRTVLEIVCEQFDAGFFVATDHVVITSAEQASLLTTTRCHRLPLSLNASDADTGEYVVCNFWQSNSVVYRGSRLAELVTTHVMPDSWDEVGGQGSITAISPVLIVTQSDRIHRQVARYLAGLTDFTTSTLRPDGATPLPFDTENAARLHAALSQPAEIEASQQPLIEILEEQAALHGFEGRWMIDVRALGDIGLTERAPVWAQIVGLPLAAALDEVLGPLQLDWTVRDDLLCVSSADEIAQHVEPRFYPVPWWTADESGLARLAEIIVTHVDAESWNEAGGFGAIDELPGGLVITQSRPVQLRVAIFLEQISQIVTGRVHPCRPAYAVGSPDPPGCVCVCDVRRWLQPTGPFTHSELEDLVGSAVTPWDQGYPAEVVRGIAVAGCSAETIARLRRLLADEEGCLTRIAALPRNGTPGAATVMDDAIAICRTALADPSPFVRCYAVKGAVIPPSAINRLTPEVIALLQDQEDCVRFAAIEFLAGLDPRPKSAAAPLVRLLDDRNGFVRDAARQALIDFGPHAAGALPALRARVRSDSSLVVLEPLLRAIGPGSAAFLAEFIEPPTPLFATATDVLEHMGADAAPALPALRTALHGGHGRYQFHRLCKVLVAIGPAADPAILDLIEIVDRDDEDAQAACIALGQLARRADIVVPALDRAAGGSEVQITRHEACLALGKFGVRAASALPTLHRIRESEPTDAVHSPARQAIEQIEAAMAAETAQTSTQPSTVSGRPTNANAETAQSGRQP